MPDLLDMALDSPDTDMEVLSSGAISRQYSRDATASTVSIQGSGNHYHACASDEYEDVGFDPSILPPPDPWIDSVTDEQLDINFNNSTLLEVRVIVYMTARTSVGIYLFQVHMCEESQSQFRVKLQVNRLQKPGS